MALVQKDDKELTVATTSSPIKKKPKPKVLDEDEYLEKLETIIQRDFFPDLAKLQAQTEYLDAVEKNDVEKIRDLQLRYSRRRTEKPLNSPRSPAYFETPIMDKNRDDGEDDQPTTSQNPEPTSNFQRPLANEEPPADEIEPSKIDKLGVDEFLAKYTSEDNASFDEIMERTEIKNRLKHEWLYKAEEEHKKRMGQALALAAADEQMLAITDGKGFRNNKSIQNWDYKSLNAVMFHPDGAEWSPEELLRRKKMAEREIIHENTRFAEDPFNPDTSQQLMTKAAIVQSAVSKGKVDAQGNDVVKLPQFSFVATPSPAPGVNESPMMTWGEIEGSPFRLDAGDMPVQRTPGPTFKMPEVPLRDKLADQLTDEISKRNRERKQTAINTVSRLTPKFGSTKSVERLATLSPAAQRLATSKLGIRIGTDKALKASYTPSPLRSMVGDKTPIASSSLRQSGDQSTPASARKRATDANDSTRTMDESLTDNLLQLKGKKPRAADFF